jgi:hypothetical protein
MKRKPCPKDCPARHADADVVGLQQIRVIAARVLGTAVGVMDQTRPDGSARQRHP